MRKGFLSTWRRDNTKKEGEEREEGRWRGKEKEKNCFCQKGKEKKGKGKRMDRGKSNLDSGTWVLFFFLFFSDPKLLIFEYSIHFIQHFINPTK